MGELAKDGMAIVVIAVNVTSRGAILLSTVRATNFIPASRSLEEGV
jgi:hypothetical protein